MMQQFKKASLLAFATFFFSFSAAPVPSTSEAVSTSSKNNAWASNAGNEAYFLNEYYYRLESLDPSKGIPSLASYVDDDSSGEDGAAYNTDFPKHFFTYIHKNLTRDQKAVIGNIQSSDLYTASDITGALFNTSKKASLSTSFDFIVLNNKTYTTFSSAFDALASEVSYVLTGGSDERSSVELSRKLQDAAQSISEYKYSLFKDEKSKVSKWNDYGISYDDNSYNVTFTATDKYSKIETALDAIKKSYPSVNTAPVHDSQVITKLLDAILNTLDY